MPTILSTKKLSLAQKELALNSGLGLVEYDAIKIELLKVDIEGEIEHAIFTSKNAVKAILNSEFRIKKCYCVGENTKKLLEERLSPDMRRHGTTFPLLGTTTYCNRMSSWCLHRLGREAALQPDLW